jgi:hypothetical protein
MQPIPYHFSPVSAPDLRGTGKSVESDGPSSSGSKTPTSSVVVAQEPQPPHDGFDSLKTVTPELVATVNSGSSYQAPILSPDLPASQSPLARFMSLSKQDKTKKLEKKNGDQIRPGSSRGELSSKAEEKKRIKELEKVQLERLAAEAKLRAKKLTNSSIAAVPSSFFETPVQIDQNSGREMMAYTSMGGM